jgi:NAD(P)-dependent dehydrogenase (short-subunit alcohol dehydrogenase family)
LSEISFEGEVAIVTGAGRGLARAYALELAQRGAAVMVNNIGTDESTATFWADTVASKIAAAAGEALASCHDVSTAVGGQALFDTI